jgi:hypothetical protein
LEYRWTFEFSEGNCRGSKLIGLKSSLYHWKILETWMFKMGWHEPFWYLKHKLLLKEGLGVKLPIWLSTTKNQESPWFIYVQVVCHIFLESSWRRLQLCFKPHLNHWSAKNVMGLQNHKSPSLGVLRQNDIWLQASWLGIKNIIRGKLLCINQLVVWFVQVCVNNWLACHSS